MTKMLVIVVFCVGCSSKSTEFVPDEPITPTKEQVDACYAEATELTLLCYDKYGGLEAEPLYEGLLYATCEKVAYQASDSCYLKDGKRNTHIN